MNSRFFKLFCIYSSSLEMSKVGEFPWSWLLGDCTENYKEKEKFVVACYVFHKKWNYAFSHHSHAEKAKKCTKKCDARANVLFCLTSLLLFWSSHCCRRRRCLRSLLRVRGHGFSPPIMNVTLATFEGKIEKNWNQTKSLAVGFSAYLHH